MLLELTRAGSSIDWMAVARLLREADPLSTVDLDPAQSRIRISGPLSAERAIGLLGAQGYIAERLPHVSGGSTCCGSCA